jgi:hypothetical protein
MSSTAPPGYFRTNLSTAVKRGCLASVSVVRWPMCAQCLPVRHRHSFHMWFSADASPELAISASETYAFAAPIPIQVGSMACNREPLGRRTTRLRRSVQAVRERSSHIRERLRPQNLRAPSLDWLNFLIAVVRGGWVGPLCRGLPDRRAGLESDHGRCCRHGGRMAWPGRPDANRCLARSRQSQARREHRGRGVPTGTLMAQALDDLAAAGGLRPENSSCHARRTLCRNSEWLSCVS